MKRTTRTDLKTTGLLASLAVCGLASSASAAISLVGVYDENANNADAVDVVSTGSDLTLQQTKDRSATAFADNTGGVWNFDTAVSGEWTSTQFTHSSFDLQYGSNTLTINLRNSADTADHTWNQISGNAISGTQHAGQQQASPYLLKLSTPLTMFAITQLDSGQAARTSSITAFYADNTTRSTTTAASNTDTLHVLTGTASNPITAIRLNNNNYIRWDDLAFDAIPEPSVALLGGLGVLALLRRRR